MSHTAIKSKDRTRPSKQPWTVEVDVHLESDCNPPQFTVESVVKNGPGANGKLVFDNRGRPGFKILFHLHDETDEGYVFPNDEREAVWSQLGANSCPERPVWNVLEPIRVFDRGKTLTVRNPNPSPAQGEFTYSLRVTKDDGKTYLLLDPGGMNQNGNMR